MVAQTGSTPILIAANAQLADARQHVRWQKNVVDVVARAIFLAVAPIERRHRLAALPLAAQLVIGTDQSKLGQGGDGVAVVDAPPGPVPKHVIVEVSSDNRRTLRQKIAVLL